MAFTLAGKFAHGELWRASLVQASKPTFSKPSLKVPRANLDLLRCQCRHFSSSGSRVTTFPAGARSWSKLDFSFSPRLLSISVPQATNGESPHFKRSSARHPLSGKIETLQADDKEAEEKEGGGYTLPHPIWSKEEAEKVQVHHTPPVTGVDKLAYYAVQLLRLNFDIFSGYIWGKLMGTLDERKWLIRIIFLETIAGVPGMIGAMSRHLKSLRLMQRDHGWIHTLLEEAENERMHLLTAMELRCPGKLFRGAVVVAQGIFTTLFWIIYPFSARFCHRFVGYLEEEAVKTYTLCLECIDEGKLPMWEKMPAPEIAVNYWRLGDGAMMRDVILAIRADEAHHRVVNHTLSSMDESAKNPHKPGY